MSSKYFKFKSLLVCVVIGILTSLVSKYIFNSTSLITVYSGLIAFCIAAVFYIYFNQVLVLQKLENLHQGIMSYEHQINERLHELTNSAPTRSDFEFLEQDIKVLHEKSIPSKAAQSLVSSTQHDDEIAPVEENKVVKLHPEKSTASEDNYLHFQLDLSDEAAWTTRLIKGLKIQLQPAISLGSKEIYSFDVLPCLIDEEHGFINCNNLKSIFSNKKHQRIICQITLDQTINLVRRLRRQKKSPLVFVELLAKTINGKQTYENFVSTLQAHHQVKKNIVIEISQIDYLSLNKSGLAKLRLILDLGYTLSMSNCTDVAAVKPAIKQNLFNHIKLTIDTIEELCADEKNAKGLEIVSLCRDAHINIIVSGVKKDYQVIQLIDNNLEVAEGRFFSTPKFPSQSDDEKVTAVKK